MRTGLFPEKLIALRLRGSPNHLRGWEVFVDCSHQLDSLAKPLRGLRLLINHHASSNPLATLPAFVFPSVAFLDTVPTRVASLWIGSRLRLDSNAQVLHLDSEDKIMACISIGEGFHMVHNGCASIEFPHCQHCTCTNAHRSSIASTIVDVASTRPEPFVQYFSICELCSACIDNAISSNDHPAHGGECCHTSARMPNFLRRSARLAFNDCCSC